MEKYGRVLEKLIQQFSPLDVSFYNTCITITGFSLFHADRPTNSIWVFISHPRSFSLYSTILVKFHIIYGIDPSLYCESITMLTKKRAARLQLMLLSTPTISNHIKVQTERA